MKKVAIVTCRVLPEKDPDQELLLVALRKAGLEPSMLAWDDPVADPAEHDLCVIRSCWDYFKHPGSFLKWIERADKTSRLVNPASVVRWNYHKRYLAGLASAGVPVVPTVFFERGEEAVLATIMATRKWDDVVIKPSVSASSFRTKRFARAEAKDGNDFLRELLRDRDAMVQKYMPAVEGEGERAVVWIDGEFTHTVRKSPRFAGSDEKVSAAKEVTAEERALAEQALAKVHGMVGTREPLLYARVDMVRGTDGTFAVSETELIEPSLFLLQHPPALERLVAAIEKFAEGRVEAPMSAFTAPAASKPAGPGSVAPASDRQPGEATTSAPQKAGPRKFGGRTPDGRKPLGWKPTGRTSGGRKLTGGSSGEGGVSGGRSSAGSSHGGRSSDRKPGEWKPRTPGSGDRKSGGWKPSGPRSGDRKQGEWKPRDRKPGEWKSSGPKTDDRKSGEWKSRGPRSSEHRPGEWKPASERPGYRDTPGWKAPGQKSGDRKTGGWKPRGGRPDDRKAGGWKPASERPGYGKPAGWKPPGPRSRDQEPGVWKPPGETSAYRKPGEWKPAGPKSSSRKPGAWKPTNQKPGDKKPGAWKPTGQKPGDKKPGDRKIGDRKPPGRKPGPRRSGGSTSR